MTRFSGIEFRRGPEPGWQIATVYGLASRPLRFNLVRWMDGDGWLIEPAHWVFGVRQERAALGACDDFLENSMIRGPHPTLREAKYELRAARRFFVSRRPHGPKDDQPEERRWLSTSL